MPQDRLKVKSKNNKPVFMKKKNKNSNTTRKNKPVKPKSDSTLKQIINRKITKNVNAALEAQIRDIASDKKVFLSKKKNKPDNATGTTSK